MKKKLIATTVALLLITVVVAVWQLAYNRQTTEYSIEFDQDELAWLSGHANSAVYYYLDVQDPSMAGQLIEKMSLLMQVPWTEVQEGDENFDEALVVSHFDETFDGGYLASRALYFKYAGIYHLVEGTTGERTASEKIGLLTSEAEILEHITSEMPYMTFIAVESEDVLYSQMLSGNLRGCLMTDRGVIINHGGQVLARKERFELREDDVRLYMPKGQGSMTSVINKIIDYMNAEGTFDDLRSNAEKAEREEAFWASLTEGERGLLQEEKVWTVGIEDVYPSVVVVDSKFYGAPVGFLSAFADLSGIQLDYVIGEKSKLTEKASELNMSMIWYNHHLTDMAASKSIATTDYVYVGIGSQPEIGGIYDLLSLKTGVMFDTAMSTYLKAEVPKAYVLFYTDESEMMEALKAGLVDVVAIPRLNYSYYERQGLIQGLMIRHTSFLPKESTLNFPTGDMNKISLVNKAVGVLDQDDYIDKSLEAIPLEKESTNLYLEMVAWVLLAGGLITLFLIGLYLLNRREKRQMNYLFTHDQVTYLPNKYGLKQIIDGSIEAGNQGYLILIDIDGMSEINDRLGHVFGDQVIIEFAQKLMSIVDDRIVLGRSGGDEFLVAVKDADSHPLEKTLEDIRSLARNYGLSRAELYDFTVAMASTVYPEYEADYEDLYRYLEYTIELAKTETDKSGYKPFDYSIFGTYKNEKYMAEAIKKGLEQNEFVLYVQPQFSLPEKVLVGGELLVRWLHPEKGIIPPGIFLPVAEKYGLIRELDYYVFDLAGRMIGEWQRAFKKMGISVNMTTVTFEDEKMPERLTQSLQAVNVDRSWLTVEITEDMGLENMEEASSVFRRLKALGIGIALDDFGKGYSSLSYLEKLEFDVLKIDKAFVDNIHLNRKSWDIFKSIVQLAKVMGVKIVAEGIEEEQQSLMIGEFEGLIGQGYYYSKPLPSNQFETLAKEQGMGL